MHNRPATFPASVLLAVHLAFLAGCTTPVPPRHESQAAPGVDLTRFATGNDLNAKAFANEFGK